MKKIESKIEKVGTIGIDVGLCWIGDPCHVLHKENGLPTTLGKDWGDFCSKLDPDKNPTAKSFNHERGHEGLGICVSTGVGDGPYDVYAEIVDLPDWGPRIKKVWVEFITDEEIEGASDDR